ncbi:DEAD/DEAH box helicase [Luteimonas sp. FCS-9]|uniref:DEAD/DEAH box helicase n=1 Tax=Luteimonas sp. FCS-9 TaxID=1547516 RepID=UPI0006993A1E|nr:DEAD/DEAH box helicase [Luteimonas sp. FCS-9]
MPLDTLHPAVAQWFGDTFAAPTPAQVAAWPAIAAGRDVLVSAPTGSGKTLTAFLVAIDGLVREGLEAGGALPDATRVVYVSPLKALSNDVRINLQAPLAGIAAALAAMGLPDVGIRTAVRTGDTPQAERARMRRRPPHILVTTPESLYVLLGSASGRAMLGDVRSVIVDEIHAVAGDKRGSHLTLTLERLQALCGRRLQRVGLSATQKPIGTVARFLVGERGEETAPAVRAHASASSNAGERAGTAGTADTENGDCTIVEVGLDRPRDLALELPPTPLSAVLSNDQAMQLYRRIADLAQAHRTTLVFVNTRRMAERAARHLGELLGRERVAAHHGSLAREARLDAEQRLKRGELTVLVATASLELGIDIGDVDLVCQIGSPRSIAAFLQRAGRSRHQVGGVPKARLLATTRDELVECAALLDCVRRGELDTLRIPPAPLDVLAQQIVAETAMQDWDEDALFALVRRAWPYRALARADFDAVVRMLAEGFVGRHGPRAGHVHRDAVHRRLRGRKGARMVATMSGGTIPDTGDYTVLLEPESQSIGTVNEDFAVESLTGDVFQLGNASYRILRVEAGRLRVEDAQGLPPNIPFWIGEAPGRTDALSAGVSRLRAQVEALLDAPGAGSEHPRARAWLQDEAGVSAEAATQLVDYLARARDALGGLPTQSRLVLERFFDATGGTQLVLHTPFGSRINRAWGLALRKRFCRKFNFELQAAATEDAIVLSLSTSHSFPLAEVMDYLRAASAREVLVQALLDAPLFGVRWRWNATTALALPRFAGGRKVAPQLQRMKSEDLLAAVFPDQVACLENIVGEREIPEHPLVAQTLYDCLEVAMDASGWLAVLRGVEAGRIEVLARELTAPSPLAAEAINARPYAFLDDAPLEERRTQAVQQRRWGEPAAADDLGRLDPEAIARVRDEAWPEAETPDEMHDALMMLGAIADDEAAASAPWPALLAALADDARATRLPVGDGAAVWVAVERLPQLRALHPGAAARPEVVVPAEYAAAWTREDALLELVRARLGGLGPVTAEALAAPLGLAASAVLPALHALEHEGTAMQGRFSGEAAGPVEWCERGLLARIHRETLGRLRREIEPVPVADYVRFLCDWQRVSKTGRVHGAEALAGVLAQLEGYEAPAGTWESDLLPARLADFSPGWLDAACTSGRVAWLRLRPRAGEGGSGGGQLRQTPVALLPRQDAARWMRLAPAPGEAAALSSRARRVDEALARHGASFFDDLQAHTRLLQTELEEGLSELVAAGRAHCDSFAGLRALLVPPSRRPSTSGRRRRMPLVGIADAGRWSQPRRGDDAPGAEDLEHVARVLLRRYGVVCWRILEREPDWLPPWRELVRVYRRLEARGEIRGGRFVAGLSGEQYALPEAVGLLRAVRARPADGELLCVGASDPLNLAGTLLPGERVPRQPGARLVLRDGRVVATRIAERCTVDDALDPSDAAAARALLQRPRLGPGPACGVGGQGARREI